jgi:MFS family permease
LDINQELEIGLISNNTKMDSLTDDIVQRQNGNNTVPRQRQNGINTIPTRRLRCTSEHYGVDKVPIVEYGVDKVPIVEYGVDNVPRVEDGVDIDGCGSGKDSGFSTSPCNASDFQVLVDIEVYNGKGDVVDKLGALQRCTQSGSQRSLESVSTTPDEEKEEDTDDSEFSDTNSEHSTDTGHIDKHNQNIEIIDYFSTVINENNNGGEQKGADDGVVGLESGRSKDGGDKYNKGKLFLIFLLGLLEFLSGSALSVLAPFYTTEAQKHGLSVKGSSIVFASVFLLQILCTPVFGRYIATLGSIRLLFLGCLCSGLANIGFGFVHNIQPVEWFFCASIVMRCITAIGESAMNVAVYPLARRLSGESYRTTVLSCMETSFGLGTMSGPFLGGLMYEYGGFTLPFLVCGILLVITGTTVSILLLLVDRAEAKDKAEHTDKKTTANPDAVEFPKLRLRKVLKVPGVLMPLLIVVFTGMSCQWYQPTLEPFLSEKYNISGFKAALFLIIDGAVYAIMSPMIGMFLDKTVSPRLFLVFGCSTISLAFFVLGPFYLPGPPHLAQIGIGLGLHGVGMAANFIGTLSILSIEMEKINSDSVEKSTAMSTCLWMTAESVGSFLGSLAGGTSFEAWGWDMSCLLNASLQCIGVVLVIGFSLIVFLGRTKKMPEERKPLLDNKSTSLYNSV